MDRLSKRLLSLFLVVSILVSTVACSESTPDPQLSDSNEVVITEKIEEEDLVTEETITELIETEEYVEEIILVESEITELLLKEDMIDEVSLCKTIYVPQENIEEFADNSFTVQLLGGKVGLKSVLGKVAIGTGLIITLSVVKSSKLPKSVASIVVSAASDTLKTAKTGAVIGSLFGAFTGAGNEIDDQGRISAVLGFAMATVGVICSIVSFAGAIPSGGTSAFGVAEGIHLAFAGIKLLAATAGEYFTGKDMVKSFVDADAIDIDWDNIDWDKVGVSAAQKAIKNGADGYMWGAVYGLIDGSIEGYYQKYCTPYTKYKNRLKQVPKDGKKGKWSGKRGESDFILDEPITLSDGTQITKVTYQNAVPDFSPYAKAEVKIPNMTNNRIGKGGNYEQADKALAEYWTKIKYNNKSWTASDVESFRDNYPCKLTWHEMSNMETMQLVPYEVNSTFGHFGGVAEYNAMIGKEEVSEFD